MKRYALIAAVLALLGTAATAQTQDPGPWMDTNCPVPEEGADFVICPEDTLTKGSGSFVLPTVWIRDERYGWLRMTVCDGVVVACETNYVRAAGVVQGESIEITLDEHEPGDGN